MQEEANPVSIVLEAFKKHSGGKVPIQLIAQRSCKINGSFAQSTKVNLFIYLFINNNNKHKQRACSTYHLHE